MGKGLTALDMTLSIAQILLFLEISPLSSLDCCTIPDLLSCLLKASSSKPSGQLIIFLKILKGFLVTSKEREVQLVCQELQNPPWSPTDSSELISYNSTGHCLDLTF